MGSVNKVILVGNLGADPDLKFTSTNKAVCNLKVATTSKYKDNQGKQHEDTEWHRITVWGEQAQACAKYLTKGQQVYLEGHLKTETYEKDGSKRYSTGIVASSVVFLGGGGQGNYSRSPRPSQDHEEASPARVAAPPENSEKEDMPF